MNPVMGKSCHQVCTHAHTYKYSNTAAAGEGVEQEDILSRWVRSVKVTPPPHPDLPPPRVWQWGRETLKER